MIYKRCGTRQTVSDSITTYGNTFAPGTIPDYIVETISSDAVYFYGLEWERLFEGSIGISGAGCPVFDEVSNILCTFSGTYTRNLYKTVVWGSDPFNYVYGLSQTEVITVSNVEGEETADHIAWEVEHAAWVIDHAAWVVDHAAWVIAHAEWVDDWASWDAGGQVGPEPEEPTEPTEPVEPVEPPEFYLQCDWLVTITTTEKVWSYLADGTRVDEPDIVTVTAIVTDAPIASFVSYDPAESVEVWEDGYDFEGWQSLVDDAMSVALLTLAPECKDTSCEFYSDPYIEDGVGHVSIGKEAGYRYCVPEDYSTDEAPRSVYEVQWDVGFFTSIWLEWYASDQSDPEPIPIPQFHSQEDWTWSGDMEDPCSPSYVLPKPTDFGLDNDMEATPPIVWETKRLNVLVVCWHSSVIGVKPTAHGFQYAWPEI